MHPTTVQKDLLKFKLRGEVKGSQIIINKNDFEHIVTCIFLQKRIAEERNTESGRLQKIVDICYGECKELLNT